MMGWMGSKKLVTYAAVVGKYLGNSTLEIEIRIR
jgi:hypothetical protein